METVADCRDENAQEMEGSCPPSACGETDPHGTRSGCGRCGRQGGVPVRIFSKRSYWEGSKPGATSSCAPLCLRALVLGTCPPRLIPTHWLSVAGSQSRDPSDQPSTQWEIFAVGLYSGYLRQTWFHCNLNLLPNYFSFLFFWFSPQFSSLYRNQVSAYSSIPLYLS